MTASTPCSMTASRAYRRFTMGGWAVELAQDGQVAVTHTDAGDIGARAVRAWRFDEPLLARRHFLAVCHALTGAGTGAGVATVLARLPREAP